MTTIKDISKLTGLSLGTISKFLNGKPILEKNAIKIQEAINSTNYQVNAFARGLKANRTMSIGILIHHWQNPFLMEMISTLEQKLCDKGYSISVCAYNGSSDQEDNKFRLLSARSDAMVIMPFSIDGKYLETVPVRKIPIISIDRPVADYECDTILVDSMTAAYSAIEVFLRNGHKRIALLSGTKQVYTAQESIKGYRRAYEDYNLEIDDSMIVCGDYQESTGSRLTKELLSMKNPPSAIFATTAEMTRGALAAISTLGLRIPEDISFIGHKDSYFISSYLNDISQILLPAEEMATILADLLVARINNDTSSFPRFVRLKTQFSDHVSVKNLYACED